MTVFVYVMYCLISTNHIIQLRSGYWHTYTHGFSILRRFRKYCTEKHCFKFALLVSAALRTSKFTRRPLVVGGICEIKVLLSRFKLQWCKLGDSIVNICCMATLRHHQSSQIPSSTWRLPRRAGRWHIPTDDPLFVSRKSFLPRYDQWFWV